MASEPLIPCPGCGRKESPDEPLGCLLARRIWRVTCGCGWQGPAELTEQRAIAAWNKRVPDEALVRALKDLRWASLVQPSCQKGAIDVCRCLVCASLRADAALRSAGVACE